MQSYLIDGYNLGHKIPEVVRLLRKKDFYTAIERIVAIVQKRINTRRHPVTIVFDGKKGIFTYPHTISSIEIRFSRKPQEADDIIREILRNDNDPSHWTVVSSDNEILKTARDLGAKFIRSEAFYGANASSRAPADGEQEFEQKFDPTNIDIDFWKQMFGDDDEASS